MSSKPSFKNALLNPQDKVGRYVIQKKLASGGFGVVYMALRDDGQQVALKEFLPSIFSCRPSGRHIRVEKEQEQYRFSQGLASFFREADTLAKIQSTRIIPIWDVFKENGTAYFAMPVERGGTLQALIRMSRRGVSEVDLRHIFVEACKGVEVLHQHGLLHLDLKPSNLWVRPDRSVLVLDLGASRWEDDQVKNMHMARTPGFAAPEQHGALKTKGQPHIPLSAKTDIYGMCASLLSCLSGHPPLSAPERRPFFAPVAWSQMGQASTELLQVIEQGMSMRVGLRQKDMSQLRSQLENLPRLQSSPRWSERLSLKWSST